MRDLYSDIRAVQALASASRSAAITGPAIDLLGVGRMAVIVNTGAITGDGDFGATLQESDDGSTGWTDVDAAQIQSDAPATLAATTSYRLGYLGWKRHVRLSLTKAGGTSMQVGAVAVLTDLAERPVP
ncbi:hypothetical protein [Szabonella alba]|uniref:Uncharacterized protein n=1 Tax=Szabonella alba TaxID=2804194 RepID=A0A8K0Y1V7_9RHOB|nr:hypothetical protein [Szabonella alba]MBL4919321.1 hypothetical protein [Szabonella alba]